MEHSTILTNVEEVDEHTQEPQDNKLEEQSSVKTPAETAVKPNASETPSTPVVETTLGRNGKMVYNFIKAATDRRLLATNQDDTKTAAVKELAGLIGLFLTGLSWGVAIQRYNTGRDSVWVSMGAIMLPQFYLPVISGVMTAEWLFRG